MNDAIHRAIERLIDGLARADVPADAFNEYAPGSADNAIRRDNLRRYLHTMAQRQPDTLLVMEAPGYRGCRLTGVPVTSRKILAEGVPELGLFGSENGYQTTSDAGFEDIAGEQSATIVWGTLAALGHTPLIWNAYPFHPHKADQPRSNRAPRAPEIALGSAFLRDVLAIYPPQRIIAVGNVAERTLASLGVDCVRVRHPAQGGKNDFVAGLTRLLA